MSLPPCRKNLNPSRRNLSRRIVRLRCDCGWLGVIGDTLLRRDGRSNCPKCQKMLDETPRVRVKEEGDG